MYEAEAKERQREAGHLYGENHPKEVNPIMDEPLEPSKPAPTSLEKASTAFGVSKQYISDVKAIVKAAPDRAAAISAYRLNSGCLWTVFNLGSIQIAGDEYSAQFG